MGEEVQCLRRRFGIRPWERSRVFGRNDTLRAMTGLFTNEWAAAWGAALNRSAAYGAAGKDWEGALVLQAQADAVRGLPDAAAVWLDLWRGTCREARLATAADLDRARFVISGPLTVWLTVLAGDVAPAMALLQGRLTLLRGSMLGLMPHVHAATALLRVAQDLVHGAEASPSDAR